MTMMPSFQLAARKQQRLSSLLLLLLPTAGRALSTSSSSSNTPIINHLLNRPQLTHSYYALRHGQSLANVAKIISSDPQISTVQHGLSDVGRDQAALAGEMFAKQHLNHNNDTSNEDGTSFNEQYEGVAIFSSDFTRARETATLFSQQLQLHSSPSSCPIYTNNIVLQTKLRERYFGELNGGPDDQYQKVWDVDCTDPNHTQFGVEAANYVLERTTGLVLELEELLSSSGGDEQKKKKKWKVVLVAHGDVLQIMQTGFLRHEDASRHRSLEHLETATIRELTLL
eukprot:CAMPEP_0201692826 /NCGR_PEP_ID=MMETSP0578-20130828/5603_1 /ASSEMBLY_ACC=CAM_ASM_000663 /TAXON_ID=267565 /ORGANISM="Skeletonema grethea, Strain CCMP 1804" /LENGTH=283 /DNA_ID=CAMNT_0048178253 /DNA_START=37 /DNA_END=888 /DNA_ORIENTATION=+